MTTSYLRQVANDLSGLLIDSGLADRIRLLEGEIAGRIVFTTSFGLEDQALTHALRDAGSRAEIVTLDTGRLFPETYDTWAETEAAFDIRIRAYAPERQAEEDYVARRGINGFRHSLDAREECCGFRKIEPLKRALDGAVVWYTGLRAGQSANRASTPVVEFDPARNLLKVSPLADWTRADVDTYVHDHSVPYNVLHDRGFPSIGCAPCTRAVRIGESERAGRWWWEQEMKKECGLHLRQQPSADVLPAGEPAPIEDRSKTREFA